MGLDQPSPTARRAACAACGTAPSFWRSTTPPRHFTGLVRHIPSTPVRYPYLPHWNMAVAVLNGDMVRTLAFGSTTAFSPHRPALHTLLARAHPTTYRALPGYLWRALRAAANSLTFWTVTSSRHLLRHHHGAYYLPCRVAPLLPQTRAPHFPTLTPPPHFTATTRYTPATTPHIPCLPRCPLRVEPDGATPCR